ncbi:MAG: alpha/beta hydrolase [Candidatus Melainabacteria bacterium]|nr:alpha/beta hydrolase [Candidatus Melainabacteria bacterium]
MQNETASGTEILWEAKSRTYYFRLAAFGAACFIIILYLTYSPVINRDFYNVKVLFKPVKTNEFNPNWFGRNAEEVFFKNKTGKLLHGIYLPEENSNHVILVHHGQYGNNNYHLGMCGFLLQDNDALFIYDYAGFGKSEGTPTIAGMADDARSAYNCLVNTLKVAPAKIIHYGSSLGSGPATLVASESPCAGLILFSPYTSLKASARRIFPFMNIYPDFLLTDYDFDNPARVKLFHKPILIVHGTDDTTIEVGHGEQIYRAANEPKQFEKIPKQGHSFVIDDQLKTKILKFIDSV